MSVFDGYEGEMGDLHQLSDRQLEELLSGRAPEGEGLEGLAMLIEDLRTAFTVTVDEELARRHVAEAAAAVGRSQAPTSDPQRRPPLRRATRRFATMLSTLLSSLALKVAGATIAVAAVAGAGAAATGNLPDGVQAALSDAASRAGIELPAPEGDDEEVTEEDAKQEGAEEALAHCEEERQDAEEAVDCDVLETVFDDEYEGEEYGDEVADVADQNREDADDNPVSEDPEDVDGNSTDHDADTGTSRAGRP